MRSIVLIGPPGAGKSTVGELAAQLLGWPFVDLDAVGETYYIEAGWTIARLVQRISEVGYLAAHDEWQPARIHAVERVLAGGRDAVVALGAGHTDYADDGAAKRLFVALANSEVVLLMPTAKPRSSLRILRDRCLKSKGKDWTVDGIDLLDRWVRSPVNRMLASRVVIQDGATPEETAKSVVEGH